jgi:excinuclease UvrABC nuclease subunit
VANRRLPPHPIPLPKGEGKAQFKTAAQKDAYIRRLELEMDIASAALDFEKAAELRDRIIEVG